MHHLRQTLALALAAAALALLPIASACSDSTPTGSNPTDTTQNNNNNNNNPAKPDFSVKIDGALWAPDSLVYRVPYFPGFIREVVATKGHQLTGDQVILRLTDTIPGTYPVANDGNSAGITYMKLFQPNQSTEGSITITTSNGQYVEGTFNFKAVSLNGSIAYRGTEGRFKAFYKK